MKNLIWFQKLNTTETVKFIKHTANTLETEFAIMGSGSLKEWFDKEQVEAIVCDKCGCESSVYMTYLDKVTYRCPHCYNMFTKN